MSFNAHRAVVANRRYMANWRPSLGKLFQLVGFTNSCPNEYSFAEGVSKWQRMQGLSADGIIGPITWKAMQSALQSGSYALAAGAGAGGNSKGGIVVRAVEGRQTFAPAKPGEIEVDGDLLARNRLVERTLFDHADRYYKAGDYRWFFALAHGEITREMNLNITKFQQPNAIMRLNQNFAWEFIRALNGQPHEQWRRAFAFCQSLQKASIPGDVELCGAKMANVHIHVDLSTALKEVGCIPPEDYANVLVFVNRGALRAQVKLRGKFLGVTETIASQLAAPIVKLDVKVWRNAVYEKACNAFVPDPQPDFRPRMAD